MMWFWWWYESVLESNLYHFIDLGAPPKSVAFEWLNITTTHSNGFFSFVFNILFAFLNMSFENVFDRYEWTRMRVCSLCVVRSENQNIAVKNENQINNDFGREKYGAAADCSNFGCGHISAAPTPHATRSTVHANCRLHSTCKSISVHINRCRYWRRSVICTNFFFFTTDCGWCAYAWVALTLYDVVVPHCALNSAYLWFSPFRVALIKFLVCEHEMNMICFSLIWPAMQKKPVASPFHSDGEFIYSYFYRCYSSYYIFLFLFFFWGLVQQCCGYWSEMHFDRLALTVVIVWAVGCASSRSMQFLFRTLTHSRPEWVSARAEPTRHSDDSQLGRGSWLSAVSYGHMHI